MQRLGASTAPSINFPSPIDRCAHTHRLRVEEDELPGGGPGAGGRPGRGGGQEAQGTFVIGTIGMDTSGLGFLLVYYSCVSACVSLFRCVCGGGGGVWVGWAVEVGKKYKAHERVCVPWCVCAYM